IWNLKLLNEHKTEVGNNFSFIEFKVLNWARIFLIYSLLTSFIIHILYYLSPQNFYFKIIFSVFDLIAIYWIAVHGIMQRNVLSFLVDKEIDSSILGVSVPENKNDITVKKEELKNLMKRIDAHLKASEVFVNTDLTILDLADELKVHPKKISTCINTIRSQNFNSYINQWRIKKAEDLLAQKMLSHLSIEGIGKEVGFHSKSAFYSAFKKHTKTTPAKYMVRFEL
ncbi:MAG: helix-turn-helix transcriptional regulator, partial [Gramella sp.]|nr:helix-turn-helix transcriptional regulator [Christiangramia sp.]